jgi:hypothetical protein
MFELLEMVKFGNLSIKDAASTLKINDLEGIENPKNYLDIQKRNNRANCNFIQNCIEKSKTEN